MVIKEINTPSFLSKNWQWRLLKTEGRLPHHLTYLLPSDSSDEESDQATPYRENSQQKQQVSHILLLLHTPTGNTYCLFCELYYQGRDLFKFAKHLDAAHKEACQWMFMCAVCATHTSTEDEMLENLTNERAAELVSLPRECFQQAPS